MTRVKRGVISLKRRKKVLRAAKGFKWGRKSKERLAREALLHAGRNAYRGRKLKKRENRTIWQQQISAGARANGISYSKLIALLKAKQIVLNRKMLAELAAQYPSAFEQILTSTRA